VESGHGRGDGDLREMEFLAILNNFFMQFSDIQNGAFFGFVRERKFEQETVWRQSALFTLLK
jgi:hypothetical protein